MIDLDLTAAVEASASALHRDWHEFPSNHCTYGEDDQRRAERAIAAGAPVIAAQVAERIAAAIETAGRADVKWLAEHVSNTIDRARLIGAKDAWKAALDIAREAVR